MITHNNQEFVRIDAQEGIKYKLQTGIEDQRLVIINESTEHPVIWDDKESNVKIVKETRNIPRLTAKEFIWYKEAWWHKDDWYKDVYGED